MYSCSKTEQTSELSLFYDSPARIWEETLPLGNGRIGMMPDGGTIHERIIINDITMWSGSKDPEALNPSAYNYLPQIRKLLLEGKNLEAQQLMYDHFRCGGQGSGHAGGKDAPYGSFQMVGELHLTHHFPQGDSIRNYERRLSLNDAIASTQFSTDNTHYTREYFASHSGDILLVRITANKKKSVGLTIGISRPERADISLKGDEIIMEGQLNDGHNGEQGVRYLTRIKMINTGGTTTQEGDSLTVKAADEVLILISTATNLMDSNYRNNVDKFLLDATKSNYKKLKKEHIEVFREKFNRVDLYLGEQDNNTPTPKRLSAFQENNDPSFAALYFQYGRYLIISGTREGSLPLNLQGLWANQLQTPWNGDYHLNINLQMNYWPVEVCNLAELHQPLINFTAGLEPSGKATASTFYGAEGWVAHMMSNPWQFTAPGEHASWGATNTGGAWLCQHLWEHYSFSGDRQYLRTVYPLLEGASKFFLSSMIHEPENGWLVTAPSSSPENGFYMPGSREPIYVCMGPSMDSQIIRELFTNTLSAATILGIKNNTLEKIHEALPLLPPIQISRKGYLQEWLEDYEEQDPQHRHVSHLYALHPSNQISPISTPELANAARMTLNRRGDEGTGWSRAWKVNFWARLHDGNRAYKLLKSLLEPAVDTERDIHNGAGTYPNLFSAHPPFQIDGNMGGTAGIAEMLIQSHDGYIHLLPALPGYWSAGSFRGLRVRGGAEIDASWQNHKLTNVHITANQTNDFKIKVPDYASLVEINGKIASADNGFVSFPMKRGDSFTLIIKE